MSVDYVMQGWISQQEFAKLLMLGSNGRIELTPAMTDNERRDFEVHLKGHYRTALSIQVKSAMVFHHIKGSGARYLDINFAVRKSRIVSNPFFWYFFAYLSRNLMRFLDPVFLIPSTVVHKLAAPYWRGDFARFHLTASLEPKSRDKWAPWRVNQAGLGNKVVALMTDLESKYIASLRSPLPLAGEGQGGGMELPPIDEPGTFWIRPAGSRIYRPRAA